MNYVNYFSQNRIKSLDFPEHQHENLNFSNNNIEQMEIRNYVILYFFYHTDFSILNIFVH